MTIDREALKASDIVRASEALARSQRRSARRKARQDAKYGRTKKVQEIAQEPVQDTTMEALDKATAPTK